MCPLHSREIKQLIDTATKVWDAHHQNINTFGLFEKKKFFCQCPYLLSVNQAFGESWWVPFEPFDLFTCMNPSEPKKVGGKNPDAYWMWVPWH